MAETKAPITCMLCGKIVHKAYLREHYRNIHNDIAALLSSPTPAGFTLQKLEGFSTRLWAVPEDGCPKGLGYCTACHHPETSKSSDPDKIKAEIGAGHVCRPPIPRPGRKKEAQVAKATGGAGTSVSCGANLIVPFPTLVEAGINEPAEYDLEDFMNDLNAAKLCRLFELKAKKAENDLAALKAGMETDATSAGSSAEAFTRTLTELFDARGIGKWVREKHADLKEKYEKSDGYDPEYPHEPRDTLLGIVGIAKNADTLVATTDEENIQVRREMNLMRLQMEEVQRKSLALAGIINEQAAKISELEAPMRADAAAAYAAQRAEIARSMGAPA